MPIPHQQPRRRTPDAPGRRGLLPALAASAALALAALAAPADPPGGWVGVLLDDGLWGRSESADEAPRGVGLLGVVESSPAERAGLRARDRVLRVEGRPVASPGELVARIQELSPDQWISLAVERDGAERTVRVKLTSRPRNTSRLAVREGWIGVEAIDLPPRLRQHFGAPEDAGVMVSNIEPASPAEAAGFELGDVVFEIDGFAVGHRRELTRRIRSAGVGNTLPITLVRDGVEIVLEPVIDRAPEPQPVSAGD